MQLLEQIVEELKRKGVVIEPSGTRSTRSSIPSEERG